MRTISSLIYILNMKTAVTLLISVCFSLLYAGEKPNAAVIELEGRGISKDEALTISDVLRSEIIKSDIFNIIERGKVDEVLKEQGFQQTGCTTSECYVAMGQLIGADKLITGSIGKLGERYIVSVRVLDVATGRILKDETAKFEGKIEKLIDKTIPDIARSVCMFESAGPVRGVAAAPRAEMRPPSSSVLREKKPKGFLLLRYGLFISGAVCASISYLSYRAGNDIYKNEYLPAASKSSADRLRTSVRQHDMRANILMGISGACILGGGITFVF